MHEGALVLVGFMWSLSVLRGYSHYEATRYLLWPYFLKTIRIPYKVYHLMYVTKLSCTCRKRIKGRKENKRNKQNKTKQKKQKLDKMKSEKRK
jgi:hypothetical protein